MFSEQVLAELKNVKMDAAYLLSTTKKLNGGKMALHMKIFLQAKCVGLC